MEEKMSNKVRIGTRKSLLAVIQTEIVKDRILEAFPDREVEIVKIDTKGDQILDRSLTSFGGREYLPQNWKRNFCPVRLTSPSTAPKICLWISRKALASGQPWNGRM